MASKRKIESDKRGNTSKSMFEDEVEHNEDVDNVFFCFTCLIQFSFCLCKAVTEINCMCCTGLGCDGII
jgi:hypothetical protein